jgi:acetyl-CoA carboxylase biotin carboxyl carrier protein
MDLNDIKKLIALLEKSNLKKLNIKKDNVEISLEKETSSFEAPIHMHRSLKNSPHLENVSHDIKKTEIPVQEKNETSVATKNSYITSPMVGTFYASPASDKPLFVKEGDIVDEDTVVCIVEAMKVMNELKANQKGRIEKVLLKDQDPVEFGSKLFSIIPV